MKDLQIRQYLVELLEGTRAHGILGSILNGIPKEFQSKRISGIPYTLW